MDAEEVKEIIEALNAQEISLLFYKCQKMKGILDSDYEVQRKLNLSESFFYKQQREVFDKLGTNAAEFKKDWEFYCQIIDELISDETELEAWKPKLSAPKEEKSSSEEVPERQGNWRNIVLIFGLLVLVGVIGFLAGSIFRIPIPFIPIPEQPNTPEYVVETVLVTVLVSTTPEPIAETEVPTASQDIETKGPLVVLTTSTDTLEPKITGTPEPTYTPAPTEIPLLTVGSEITEDLYSLELISKVFNRFVFGARRAITLEYKFKNNSFNEILLILDSSDFILKDNLDRNYPCVFFVGVYANEEINRSVKGNEEFTFNVICGREIRFDASVEDVILSAPSVYSLPPSEWVIGVAP